jgi:SurA-like N-terminal domain
MTKTRNPWGMVTAVAMVVLLIGCGPPEPEPRDRYLVRVGSREITVRDFNRAFEIGKTAYPHNEILGDESMRKTRHRIIRELIEEAMLLDQAESRRVLLTDGELEKALADIRRDYPDNSFEELLMASAISFQDWKERLRVRLLIDKLIDQVLGSRITISEAEIAAFLKEFAVSGAGPAGDSADAGQRNETMIRQLRQRKLEQAYQTWLVELHRQYAVDINMDQWNAMTGS